MTNDKSQTPCKVIYVSGEESPQQIAMRAKRLELEVSDIFILSEINLEKIIQSIEKNKPDVVVIDSIQTIYSEELQSAPGSVTQVRECSAQLTRIAKQLEVSMILVGHVTKEGSLAGPRVLEHIVDTVLYFEGDQNSSFRMVRAFKNRFGAVNELGVFAMTEKGLREVTNPSALFLSHHHEEVSGSCITVTQEGTRPLLIEIQALVDNAHGASPKRLGVGLEQNRLSMLLAVLNRHGGIACFDQDVFVNAGDWYSPYDGAKLSDRGDVDIDHVVALKEAWDSGAWAWTESQRKAYANDITDQRTLIAVTDRVNVSKSDKDPSNWMPPLRSYWCTYLGDWISVKARWNLSMDQSEFGRIKNLLNSDCLSLTIASWSAAPVASTISTVATTTTSTIVAVTGSTTTSTVLSATTSTTTIVKTTAPTTTMPVTATTAESATSQLTGVKDISPGSYCAPLDGLGSYKGLVYICSKTNAEGTLYSGNRARWRKFSN